MRAISALPGMHCLCANVSDQQSQSHDGVAHSPHSQHPAQQLGSSGLPQQSLHPHSAARFAQEHPPLTPQQSPHSHSGQPGIWQRCSFKPETQPEQQTRPSSMHSPPQPSVSPHEVQHSPGDGQELQLQHLPQSLHDIPLQLPHRLLRSQFLCRGLRIHARIAASAANPARINPKIERIYRNFQPPEVEELTPSPFTPEEPELPPLLVPPLPPPPLAMAGSPTFVYNSSNAIEMRIEVNMIPIQQHQ